MEVFGLIWVDHYATPISNIEGLPLPESFDQSSRQSRTADGRLPALRGSTLSSKRFLWIGLTFLLQLLLEPSLPMPWLRKHSLIALRDLSKTSLLYPHCYALKDIIFDSHESGGAFSDVHKGRYDEQLLCLKVVRLHQKSDTEAMLRVRP